MESFDAREVTINDSTFRFEKMLPMEAFDLFERMRPGLAKVASEARIEGKNDVQGIVSMILLLPPETVVTARRGLFKHVHFQRTDTSKFSPVFQDEDMALKDLEMVHIYELIGRAFFVNFIDSWTALLSRLPEAESFNLQDIGT